MLVLDGCGCSPAAEKISPKERNTEAKHGRGDLDRRKACYGHFSRSRSVLDSSDGVHSR